MLVWKGWGILALIIPLVLSIGIGAGLDANYGKDFYINSTWAMPMVFAVSSFIVLIIGKEVNNKPGKILIDPENNKEVEIKTIHSMFWIPLQYWGLIILVISIWMYIANIGLIYR